MTAYQSCYCIQATSCMPNNHCYCIQATLLLPSNYIIVFKLLREHAIVFQLSVNYYITYYNNYNNYNKY